MCRIVPGPRKRGWRRHLSLMLALTLTACAGLQPSQNITFGTRLQDGQSATVRGFLGGVVADEPNAALVGRQVLAAGGNAADAAVAIAFALAVTYPSRAGLGGGGACLAHAPPKTGPGKGRAEAVLFLPRPPAHPQGGDRPAAVPMLARGLFALHAKYGSQRFETLITPAEQMARFGVTVSRALQRDLAVVAGPLAADPSARAMFAPDGAPLAEGARLLQPGLGATLAQLRVAGVGDLYQGSLARLFTDGARQAGGGLTEADLRAAIPRVTTPIELPAGDDVVAFLPPPADGGLGAAAAFQVLQRDPNATEAAGARGLAAAARWRAGGATPAAILATTDLPPAQLPALPASTTFAAIDRAGGAVVCAVTMNNLFGTGRIAPGTGIVLAASPEAVPPPLLAAALRYNTNIPAFRALAGGAGQAGAPLAAAVALQDALARRDPAKPAPILVPEPGRANVIACPLYLPDNRKSCFWTTDPRGAGLAVGSTS